MVVTVVALGEACGPCGWDSAPLQPSLWLDPAWESPLVADITLVSLPGAHVGRAHTPDRGCGLPRHAHTTRPFLVGLGPQSNGLSEHQSPFP